MRSTSSRRSLLATTAALSLGVPIVGVALPAAADALECGDTIMVSTVLTQNLSCTSGDGLVIGADNVVLDLDGHTISGAGPAGVRIAQRTGVTVTNGEITGFAAAIELQQSHDSTISEIFAHGGGRGINVGTGSGHLIEKSVIQDYGGDAIKLSGSVDTVVSKNVVSNAVWGIAIEGGSGNLAEKNMVNMSRDTGIAVWGGALDTVLDKNRVSQTARDGILVQADTTHTELTKNEAYNNGDDGIEVASTSASLGKNLAMGNTQLGIDAVIGVTDLGGNMAAGNGDPAQCTGVTCTAP